MQDTRHLHGILDILYLLEVMILGFFLNATCPIMWLDNVLFSSQHEVSRGGVVTFLSPYLSSSTISYVCDLMNMIVWILFSFHNHSFGIVSVDGPNDGVEQSQMWL